IWATQPWASYTKPPLSQHPLMLSQTACPAWVGKSPIGADASGAAFLPTADHGPQVGSVSVLVSQVPDVATAIVAVPAFTRSHTTFGSFALPPPRSVHPSSPLLRAT